MSRALLAAAALLAGALAGCSSVEDTAVPPAELPDIEREARIEPVWRRTVGSNFNRKWVRLAPALLDDRVYAANVDGTVAALALANGRPEWEVKLDRRLSAGVGVDGERVYVGSAEGQVIALDRDSGAELWRHTAGGELLAPPAAADGLVAVRTVDGRLVALSASDGTFQWSHSSDVPSLSLRGNSTPLMVPGGVVAGLDNGRVIALSAADGRPLWETEVAPPEGRSPIERMVDIDGSIGIGRNVLYAATYQGRIAEIEPQRGRIRWSRDVSTYFGLNLDRTRLYLTDVDSHVLALSPSTGSTQWRQEQLHHRRLTAPVPVPDTPWLAVADFDGYVHLLERSDGRIVARERLVAFGVLADPVPVAGGRLLVLTQDSELILLATEARD